MYLFEQLQEFHGAQFFTEDTAFFGVRLQEERTRGRGRHQVTEIKDALVFVSSDRELLPADTEALRLKGFYVQSLPPPPLPRFSPGRIQAWVDGASVCPDPVELFFRVRSSFTDRIDYQDATQADVVALYTLGTYLHRDFDAFPYLAFFGSKASGKTKNGKIIGELAFNAVEAVTLTGGALYLEVEAHAATLLLDDREDLAGEEARAINAMLNAGYKRGGQTIRGSWDTQSAKRFGIYSPKVITSVKGVNPVLQSRCIVIEMQPSTDRAKRKRSEDVGAPFWQIVRDDLYTWALCEFQAVRTSYVAADPEEIEVLVDGATETLEELSGRSWELWRPIVALADYFDRRGVEGLLQRVAAYAWQSYREGLAAEVESIEAVVLSHLHETCLNGRVTFTPKELARDVEEITGERVKSNSLGWMLRRLGFARFRVSSGSSRRYEVPRQAVEEAAERRGTDLNNERGFPQEPGEPGDTWEPGAAIAQTFDAEVVQEEDR